MLSKLIVFAFVIIVSLIYRRKKCLTDKRYRYIFLTSLFISLVELIALTYILYEATGKYIPQMGVVAFAIVIDVMLSNLINQCSNYRIECVTETVIDSNILTICSIKFFHQRNKAIHI